MIENLNGLLRLVTANPDKVELQALLVQKEAAGPGLAFQVPQVLILLLQVLKLQVLKLQILKLQILKLQVFLL
ncbi:hypothetical protein BGZ99_002181 [Dissophora globulifera]|uniref:Uncharacterized protein n=1 Tax=Dissophora globulifera TaxID=979702 RepID=A0A9P6RN79_9FUNG|nr:hypothetical protein BGZ99_002181 [Dissophora globulifera]